MLRQQLIAIVALAALAPAASADKPVPIVLVNANAAGVGLNDPTPVAPVGGNPMTTLGSQRMFALQHAANIIWPQLRSSVPVRIEVSFADTRLYRHRRGPGLGRSPVDRLEFQARINSGHVVSRCTGEQDGKDRPCHQCR